MAKDTGNGPLHTELIARTQIDSVCTVRVDAEVL